MGISLTTRRSTTNVNISARRDDSITNLVSRLSSSNVISVKTRTSFIDLGRDTIGSAKELIEAAANSDMYSEHTLDIFSVAGKYGTAINPANKRESPGLTEADALKRLEEDGQNLITPPKRTPWYIKLGRQFLNPLMLLLLFAGTISIATYGVPPHLAVNLLLGILLYLVVILTCHATYSQEAASDDLMESFRTMLPQATVVIRDGKAKSIPAEDIVNGDLIHLKSGDKIPADMKVVWANALKVDQSMLTGESDPIAVGERCMHANPLEAKNLVFNGSLCV